MSIESFADSLINYRDRGILPNGFLYAVLANNLFQAVQLADSESLLALKDICQFINTEFPVLSWGNENRIRAWVHKTKH